MSTAKTRWFVVAQVTVVVAALAWAFTALSGQWQEFKQVALHTDIQWRFLFLASAMVLGTYAMLIESWRMLLSGWGSTLPFMAAVRIWTIANLGRYIPGKVWSIGALGFLAKREGVSGVAAAGAAILGTLLNIGAGFGIMALSGAQTLGAIKPWLQNAATAISVLFVIGTVLLPWLLPPVLLRVSRWRGLPPIAQHLPARTLWISTAINAVSWVGYGLAFAVFAKGIAPQISANPSMYIVVWTASYLIGYLAIIAPGGLGFREGAMIGALVALGLANVADATLLTLASRVWLTVLEILPGLLALLFNRVRAPTESGTNSTES